MSMYDLGWWTGAVLVHLAIIVVGGGLIWYIFHPKEK